MNELKERMIKEINHYILDTNDYDLDYFLSKEIVDYENQNNVELMWYVTKQDENNLVIDISIEEA